MYAKFQKLIISAVISIANECWCAKSTFGSLGLPRYVSFDLEKSKCLIALWNVHGFPNAYFEASTSHVNVTLVDISTSITKIISIAKPESC